MDDKRFRTIVEKISEYIPVTNNEEKNEIENPSYMPKFSSDYDDISTDFKKEMSDLLQKKEEEHIQFLTTRNRYVDASFITRIILDEVFQEYAYYQYGGFTKRELRESKLFTNADLEHRIEDLIVTHYDDVKLRRAEVFKINNLSLIPGKKNSAIYEFQFAKTFQNDVLLIKSSLGRGNKMKKNKTLNKAFNKAFKILSFTKYDSLLVLTPHVMEYLITLDTKYDGKIEFSFTNNKLYIRINNQNYFEDQSRIHFVEEHKIKSLLEELDDIMYLVKFLRQKHLV